MTASTTATSQLYLMETIRNMACNTTLRQLAYANNLIISPVVWEDCARMKNSCFGPRISDLTLTVTGKNNICMPMIRRNNYADVTADLKIQTMSVVVGNENNTMLKRVPLKHYLENIDQYANNSEVK